MTIASNFMRDGKCKIQNRIFLYFNCTVNIFSIDISIFSTFDKKIIKNIWNIYWPVLKIVYLEILCYTSWLAFWNIRKPKSWKLLETLVHYCCFISVVILHYRTAARMTRIVESGKVFCSFVVCSSSTTQTFGAIFAKEKYLLFMFWMNEA